MRSRFIHIHIQLYWGNRDYVVACPAHPFAADALYFLAVTAKLRRRQKQNVNYDFWPISRKTTTEISGCSAKKSVSFYRHLLGLVPCIRIHSVAIFMDAIRSLGYSSLNIPSRPLGYDQV